jgi:hypothetical protein
MLRIRLPLKYSMPTEYLSSSIDLYKSATGWVNGYWTFFSSVSLAVVGLVLGGKTSLPGRGKLAVGIAFLAVALANNFALGRAAAMRVEAKEVILASVSQSQSDTSHAARKYQELVTQLDSPSARGLRLWQGVLTLVVLAAIYLQHRHDTRPRLANEESRADSPSLRAPPV